MDMVEKEKDLIDFANRVILFKEKIVKACTERGIGAPTNKQITDYINGYDIDFESFMADYTEHEGIFIGLRTPLDDFKAEIKSRSWVTKPTEEEILTFFNKHGNNISLFLSEHNINNMKPLEYKVYLKTITSLSAKGFIDLWNSFVNVTGSKKTNSYGPIYDLSTIDKLSLSLVMTDKELETVENMVAQKHIPFIQYGKSKTIQIKTPKSIKEMITAHWSEIFKSIIIAPDYFRVLKYNGFKYFEKIVWPVITKEVGIEVCKDTNEIKYTK